MHTERTAGTAHPGALGPRVKVLPEDVRRNNRALVLQTLFPDLELSRADLARRTELTRVTISDLVVDLLSDGLVKELGPRQGSRPGKPATLLRFDPGARCILALDLAEAGEFRGAVTDLCGTVLGRAERPLGGDPLDVVDALLDDLLSRAPAPVLGIGVGSPGIVDDTGTVLSAPNLGWYGLPLEAHLTERFGLPAAVANDANVAALAEHTFGSGSSDLMVVQIGHGVGAGLLLGGAPFAGSRYAAGEIGHVVVDPRGERCACGKRGCLETWLSVPHLEAALGERPGRRDEVLLEAGAKLGTALAPVVGALNLDEIVLSGPPELTEGPLLEATVATLRDRTMAEFHGGLDLRTSTLGQDIVLDGATVLVLSGLLGIS